MAKDVKADSKQKYDGQDVCPRDDMFDEAFREKRVHSIEERCRITVHSCQKGMIRRKKSREN